MSDAPKSSQETIFAEALAQPSGEREAFVDRACADDRAMAAHVRELLRGYEENSGFLEAPPAGAEVPPKAGDYAPLPAEFRRGDRIGHYKLLEHIGEGACGIVYMAEQEEPVRRRVALKLIKLGLDTRDFIARFEAERQALALMDHPNIARVFDAGATVTGRPYLVMELVRGVPITKFCDDNRLPPLARLELFIQVCQAIQHAHQKGIIHRDIKPSNILVAVNDGVPVPKVIDFGIAKATQGRLTDKTLFTRFHAFIGTPAYSSPEQAEVTNLDVDTRSDIYSLGVLLYELLTGHQPVDHATIERLGFEELRRMIREVEPPRPSARVSSLGVQERTSVAQRRDVDAGKLALLLRSDLDWIVMRCLEKDRRRRYETASALAQDIRRHLDNEAVEARPPSSAYRLRKFIRRRKSLFVTVTGITAALIAGLIVSSFLFLRERVARSRAVAAERVEGELRQEAETARVAEVKRAARTALDLANRSLVDGEAADGLAYLVYAARKDPTNTTLAPRIASVLTSKNFMLPLGPPFVGGSRVLAVRFTHDGRSIFVGTEDGSFLVLDAATGVLQRKFDLKRDVTLDGWEFASDNDDVVAVRFTENTIGVFDTETGRARIPEVRLDSQVRMFAELSEHGHAAGLSPDGRWIYACAPKQFWLWDTTTGRVRLDPTFTEAIGGCAFSPDGGRLALTVGNGVHQWSLPDAVKMPMVVDFGDVPASGGLNASALRYSLDGRQLWVGVVGAGIHQLDATTGEQLRTLSKDDNPLNTPAYLVSPSVAEVTPGRIFFQTSTRTATWDVKTGKVSALPIPSDGDYRGVFFDATGSRGLMTSADGFVRVFDPAQGTLVVTPTWRQPSHSCAALSPDGTQVVIGTATGRVHRLRIGQGPSQPLVLSRSVAPGMPAPFLTEAPARLFRLQADRATVIDVASGREVAGGFRYPDPIIVPGGQDSKPLVRTDLKFMVVRTQAGEWQSWGLGAAGVKHVAVLQDASSGRAVTIFSPSGDLVALTEGRARVWDLRTGQPMGPYFAPTSPIIGFTPDFSPDGKRLALGTYDGSAMIVDIATGRPVTRLATRPLVPNNRVLFCPDGRMVMTLNQRGEIRFWDGVTGEPSEAIAPFIGLVGGSVFSPNGRWLANWNQTTTTLWDGKPSVSSGTTIPGGGKHVGFSADSAWLGTAERAGNIQVWDISRGEAIVEPMSYHGLGMFLPEFSPDCRFLRTENANFYVWSLPPRMTAGAAPPEWLLQLATMCATKVVNDSGQLVDIDDAGSRIAELRRVIAALPADAPYADWGRWILDDRVDRPIAPGFAITPAEAEELARKE